MVLREKNILKIRHEQNDKNQIKNENEKRQIEEKLLRRPSSSAVNVGGASWRVRRVAATRYDWNASDATLVLRLRQPQRKGTFITRL